MSAINTHTIRTIAYGLASLLAVLCAERLRAGDKVTYVDHLRPLFESNCLSCHNPDKIKGGLDLTTYTGVLEGGSGGKIVVPGDLPASRLYGLISHAEEPTMPPFQSRLSDEAINLVSHWIERGCPESNDDKPLPKKKAAPGFGLIVAPSGRPEGPPVMPEGMPFGPVVHTTRTDAVTALAVHPWSPLAAIGGQKQVVVYDTERHELLGVLPFGDGFPKVLRFTRNGRFLMAAGGVGARVGYIVLYSVTDGREVLRLGNERDTVLAADINPAQTKVALGGSGRVVKVLSTDTGDEIHAFRKHTGWITAVAYSKDGILLATADRNGGLLIWEAESHAPFFALAGHDGAITCLSWREDSNVLASAGADGRVRLWEMNGGRRIKDWSAHVGGTESVHFSSDGRIVTAGRDRAVRVWDQNGKPIRAFDLMPGLALCAAFDASGSRVIAGDLTGCVRMWSAQDGEQRGDLSANPVSVVEQLDLARRRVTEVGVELEKSAAAIAPAQVAAETASAALREAGKSHEDMTAIVATIGTDAEVAAAEENSAREATRKASLEIEAKRSAVAASRADVERQLGALKAAVDAELALESALAARRVELAQLRANAKEADDQAVAKPADTAATKTAGKAREKADRAAQALSAEEKLLGMASNRAREAMAASKDAKNRRAESVAAEEIASRSIIPLEESLANAVSTARLRDEAIKAAQSNLNASKEELDRRAKESADAARYVSEAETLRADNEKALRRARAKIAKWRAAEVRFDLDRVRGEYAQKETARARVADRADMSEKASAIAAADLAGAEQSLATFPDRLASLRGRVAAANKSVEHATVSVGKLKQAADAKAQFVTAFSVTVTRTRAASDAAADNERLAQAVAKIEEAYALLEEDVAAANQRVTEGDKVRGDAEAALATAVQVVQRALVEQAALPGHIEELENQSMAAAAKASADRAAADRAAEPVRVAADELRELETEYRALRKAYRDGRDG